MKKTILLPLAFLALSLSYANLFAQNETQNTTKKSKKVKIVVQKDNEPKKVMEWDGEGEMPKEMKEYLEQSGAGVDIVKMGKNGKIHIKGHKKGKHSEKDQDFNFDLDISKMPEMKDFDKKMEKLNLDLEKLNLDKIEKDIKIYKFDDKNFDGKTFELNMENFGKDMEKFGKDMEVWGKNMENFKFDMKDLDKNGSFVFKFNGDSLKNCVKGRVIFSGKNRDSLRKSMSEGRKLRKMEYLKDLKEGTTEETKEIDLGNGKKAIITTKRTVVIKESPKESLINNDMNESIKIFPNPNQGVFTLEFTPKTAGDARISIISNQGKVVYQEEIKGAKETIKKEITLPEKSSPTYILRIEQGGKAYTKQIVVQ